MAAGFAVLLLALLWVSTAAHVEGAPLRPAAVDDGCAAVDDASALQVLARPQFPAVSAVANASELLGVGSSDSACLCVFDIDRTLTSKQGSQCAGSERRAAYDSAYGGGKLVLSPLAVAGIKSTFCDHCYLGLVSTGDANGAGSEERSILVSEVLSSGTHNRLKKSEPAASKWTRGPVSPGENVQSPLVFGQPDAQKHWALLAIIRWYASLGINVEESRTYLFDDRWSNTAPFHDDACRGIHAVQISCGSRDRSMGGEVGYCGASPDEIQPLPPNVRVKRC